MVEITLLPLFRGGWGGPIFILEENPACQMIRKRHKEFQLSSSKRLKIVPCLKLETQHTTPTLEELQSSTELFNSVVDKNELSDHMQLYLAL